MKSFHLLVLLEVGATASKFSSDNVSFGIRRQPSFLKRRINNSKPSPEQTALSSALSIRGGAYDPYIGDIYYSEVSPEASNPEQASYDAANYGNDSPVVSSAQVLYEGGCYMSSDSMTSPESMFGSFFNNFVDSDDEEDDDDDDNDGHSSMLANGSITRSRRVRSTAQAYGNQANTVSSAVYLESEVHFQ